MWITNLIKIVFSQYEPEAETTLLDPKLLRDTRIALQAQKLLSPQVLIKECAPDLVETLCSIRISLEQISGAYPSSFKALLEALRATVEDALQDGRTYADLELLEKNLAALELRVIAESQSLKKKRKAKKYTLFAITILPIIAYGVHWGIATFVREASLVEVDVVFPKQTYEINSAELKLNPEARTAMLRDFQAYYFRNVGMKNFMNSLVPGSNLPSVNPLPHRIDASVAEDWGLRAENMAEAREAELQDFYDRHNLLVMRSFLKNIKAGNIVSRVGIEVSRTDSIEFPWHKIDVDTEVEAFVTAPGGGVPLQFGLRVEDAPITDVNVTAALNSEENKNIQSFEFARDYVTRSVSEVAPDNIRLLGHSHGGYGVFLSEAFLEKIDLNPDYEVDPRELEHFQYGGANLDHLIYGRCINGGAAVLFPFGKVDVPWMKRLESVDLHYEYSLLDGKRVTANVNQPVEPMDAYILEEGMFESYDLARTCLTGRVFEDGAQSTEASVSDTLALIDSFATMAATQGKTESPVIALEETITLDFAFESSSMSAHVDRVLVLEDGYYVLLNLVLKDFYGGNYEIRYYFDDDIVATAEIELPWPSSLEFKEGDERLFRPQ